MNDEADQPDVEIRAFRGTDRSSVYRECVVPQDVFARLLVAGSERGLRSLAALDPYGPNKLDRNDAKRFADEVAVVHEAVNEPRFGDILAVARWCTRSSANAWLRIAVVQQRSR